MESSKHQCTMCGNIKVSTNYYLSSSALYKKNKNQDNKPIMPFCKECMMKFFDAEKKKYGIEHATQICCLKFDVAFNMGTLDGVMKEVEKNKDKHPWAIYMQKVNSLGGVNGLSKSFEISQLPSEPNHNEGYLTEEVALKWGNKFPIDAYPQLEDFYNKMCASNRVETPQDADYVKKICIISYLYDEALKNGDANESKKLSDMYTKMMADAKFRATDMSGADATGGARTISQITEEVESEDFIPPWEKYASKLNIKQDIVDKTIMYMLNFVLKFKDRSAMSEPPIDIPKVGEEDVIQ